MNGMFGLTILMILTTFHIHLTSAQSSVQYLQSAIHELKAMKAKQNHHHHHHHMMNKVQQRRDSIASPFSQRGASSISRPVSKKRIDQESPSAVPPLALTKGELSAIYEAAVAKGETVKLEGGDGVMTAAIHELNDAAPAATYNKHRIVNYDFDSASQGGGHPDSDDESGYYYYYYPIKTFIDEMTSHVTHADHHGSQSSPGQAHSTHSVGVVHDPSIKPHYQYHSHAHQHTVNITALKTMLDGDKKKGALEPLFMAISGFIGMAVMFVLSVLFFPKFGAFTKKNVNKKTERFGDLARIALQAIEKQDCAERLACELGKTARTFNLGNNRFVKLLKRLAPSSFGKHMDMVENYSSKQFKCTAIPCKKKKGGQKPKQHKPNKKKS